MDEGLVYVGKIIDIERIPDSNFIVSASVVCGKGGKWKGVVKAIQFCLGDKCIVYLPDALIPDSTTDMQFMKDSGWRVRMRRFRGAPSEVVIMPLGVDLDVGTDLTVLFGVTKYQKQVPANLSGKALGFFPGFIPKTDEPNWQRSEDLIDALVGTEYYITEKCDGSSTTAYRYKGHFGVCSRNLELLPTISNGYWMVSKKYELHDKLPEGYALQWETCGPGIQKNPMGLSEINGFAFSAYKIDEHRYLSYAELKELCAQLAFPMVKVVDEGYYFCKYSVGQLGEGFYENGKQREGVVVRSQLNHGSSPISFKVINLGYDD